MHTPDALIGRLRTRWRRQRGEWLLGRGEWPLSLPTGVPSERVAAMHWAAFDAWLLAWRRSGEAGRVEWIDRSWPKLGQQRLPVRWVFESAAQVAQAVGETSRWLQAIERVGALKRRWPDADARWLDQLAAHFDLLADLPAADYERLVAVVDFLHHRGGVGLRPRQLPVAGVHSKWLGSYRGVVAAWLRALHGGGSPRDFFEVTGVLSEPDRLRIRLLDPNLAGHAGGLSDIEAPVEQLARLALRPQAVLLVENLESGLACEPHSGVVVLMGKGYAIDCLAEIGWLIGVPVVYWGDIDTHGLAILDRVRGVLPQAQSVLMDRETLLRHRQLWVAEPQQHAGGGLDRLHGDERALYDALRVGEYGPQVRLEQERLPWDHAWTEVSRVLHAAMARPGRPSTTEPDDARRGV